MATQVCRRRRHRHHTERRRNLRPPQLEGRMEPLRARMLACPWLLLQRTSKNSPEPEPEPLSLSQRPPFSV